MFNTLPLVRRTADASSRRRSPRLIWIVYGVMAALLVAYLVTLVHRKVGAYSTPLDGWGVDGFEFILSCLCLSLAFGKRRNRLIPLLLGAGLLSWTMGDVVIT
ncbi:MAG: hypothetical protein WA809_10205, partial [Candidatus Dormiibacterota bacterium]